MRDESTLVKSVPDPRDARAWLRAHGHARVADLIDRVLARWARQGKKTRRNWWDVLAGDSRGRPRRVEGVVFPVLPAAVARQRDGTLSARPRRQLRRAAAEAAPRVSRRRPPASAAPEAGPEDAPARVRGPAWREVPHPFLKWAGGKRQLLPEILKRLPAELGTFHEPFVGGGAVFFRLRPPAAVLSDRNERLIRAYCGVRESVDEVLAILKECRNDKRFYLQMRSRAIDDRPDAEVAAWLIFLNRTGFNGLYRVNSRNLFNVPFGNNAGARLYDERNLRACAATLASAKIKHEDFSAVLDRARAGDVVYFDPPYVPLSVTSYFTSYTSDGFGAEDQRRLRDVALELKRRGVFVLLSNSSAPLVRELYGRDFQIAEVSAARMVNSDVKGRGRVTELLIW
jgi:DNA adenine methylase